MAKLLGISERHSYRLIREMNFDLKKAGYMVIVGKVPKRYFKKKYYGYEV